MSEELEDVVAEIDRGKVAPIYLAVGDEFLARKVADELVKKLVPDASAGLNFAVLDGGSPREVAMELATLPMFPGRKVVLVRDPEFLLPKKGRVDALGKARDAWKAGRRKEGARRLLALAARAGWTASQLDPSRPGAPSVDAWKEELNVDLAEADLQFLKEVALFCQEERISAPEGDVAPLVELFGKGVPPGHALVIVASDLDSKNPLVTFANKQGVVIERKVAAKLKDLDVGALSAEVLRPLQKRLSKGAENALKDRVGGNMRLLQSELEKLALYANTPVIEQEDVELLVAREREEEFLELTDALQKRDLKAALRYVDDAVGQGSHPLQLLGSIASQVRGLLENHERMRALTGGQAPRNYNDFQARVFPKIEQEAKASRSRVPHPYAAFMQMQAAANFGRAQLIRALVACADADEQLKSAAGGKLTLERLLWTVCGRD